MSSSKNIRSCCLVLGCSFLLLAGCQQKKDSENGNGRNSAEATLDIAQIQSAYQDADDYSDSASLIFQYTLNGVPFEESHPLETSISRKKFLILKWFKTQVVQGDDFVGIRILDMTTQNFDGQVRITGASGLIKEIQSDEIALHFVFGHDDISWHPELRPDERIRFLGIPRALFQGESTGWFSDEKLIEATGVSLNGTTLIDAKFQSDWGIIECRFDPQKNLLLGIRLPTGLLSPEITSRPEIRDVSLSIAFGNATFGKQDDPDFRVAKTEKPVNQFVQIPETFPSGAIGKPVSGWNLLGENQQRINSQSFHGSIRMTFFGDPKLLHPDDREKIRQVLQNVPAAVAWVVPQSVNLQGMAHRFKGCEYVRDSDGSIPEFFGIQAPTFLFLTNENGVIQYFSSPASRRNSDWLEDIDAVYKRLKKGEDVASEMHNDYARFYSEYLSKIKAAKIESRFRRLFVD